MYFYYMPLSHILHAWHERCVQYRPEPQNSGER